MPPEPKRPTRRASSRARRLLRTMPTRSESLRTNRSSPEQPARFPDGENWWRRIVAALSWGMNQTMEAFAAYGMGIHAGIPSSPTEPVNRLNRVEDRPRDRGAKDRHDWLTAPLPDGVSGAESDPGRLT